ncbi:MAG TPA: hypothetical protein VI758_11320, partial [Bacteroidota bacterium]
LQETAARNYCTLVFLKDDWDWIVMRLIKQEQGRNRTNIKVLILQRMSSAFRHEQKISVRENIRGFIFFKR